MVGPPWSEAWPVFIAPVLWFYSFFEALQVAGKIGRGEPVSDESLPIWDTQHARWSRAAGWVLLLLGLLALRNNLGFAIPMFSSWLRRLLRPALLVGLGLWLLLRQLPEG